MFLQFRPHNHQIVAFGAIRQSKADCLGRFPRLSPARNHPDRCFESGDNFRKIRNKTGARGNYANEDWNADVATHIEQTIIFRELRSKQYNGASNFHMSLDISILISLCHATALP